MTQMNLLAVILAGGRGSRLFDLTRKIAKPAIHFGGKYRIIDFALSNCANSDITKVGIAVQYESIQLSSYVSHDSLWGLNLNHGGVVVLPPREKEGRGFDVYEGTANAILQNLDFLDQEKPEHVLILSGDHIYKMDYREMLKTHIASKAEATIATIEVPWKEASRFGILHCSAEDEILEFVEKPQQPKSNLASMGVYIFNYKSLRKALLEDEKKADSSHDFGKDIIPAYLAANMKLQAYRFKGYWKDVGTIDSLWEANMDLLDHEESLNLFDDNWSIYTEDTLTPPQLIGENAFIDHAYITQGCQVDGKICHSVLFTGTKVDVGAYIKDSVLMNRVSVGKGAFLTRCLVADDVQIPAGIVLGSPDSEKILLVTKKVVDEAKEAQK